jgi:hypothetical protein
MPDQNASIDEIYAWFLGYIDSPDQRVRELRDGVIEILCEGGDDGRQRVELLLTREQLKAAAWSEFDIFDDTDPDVVPPAKDPVRAGLNALTMYIDEALGTLRPDERYVVLHRGMFWGSVTREVPPVRGTWSVDIEPGSGFWSAFPPGHPRYGEPGSILGSNGRDDEPTDRSEQD